MTTEIAVQYFVSFGLVILILLVLVVILLLMIFITLRLVIKQLKHLENETKDGQLSSAEDIKSSLKSLEIVIKDLKFN